MYHLRLTLNLGIKQSAHKNLSSAATRESCTTFIRSGAFTYRTKYFTERGFRKLSAFFRKSYYLTLCFKMEPDQNFSNENLLLS